MPTKLQSRLSRTGLSLAASLFLTSGAYADSAVVTFGGQYYQRFDTVLSQDQAESACSGRGGYLAVLTSGPENDFVWNNLYDDGTETRFWIGGEQAPNQADPAAGWGWVNAEPWSFTDWQGGQEPNDDDSFPGTEDNDENCLEMRGEGGTPVGTWNDKACDGAGETRYYVCEFDSAPAASGATAVPTMSLLGSILLAACVAVAGLFGVRGRQRRT